MTERHLPEHTDAGCYRLNLGCGDDLRKGWVNADVRRSVGADVLLDAEAHALPFTDGAFDRILLDNVLEHVPEPLRLLGELHRVAAADAEITFRGPHWNSRGAWADPTHSRPFTRDTFEHELVRELFAVERVDCTRVRFGRLLPKWVALWLADHVGQIVSEIEIVVGVRK